MLHRLLDEAEPVPLPLEFLHRGAERLESDLPFPSAKDLGHPVGEELAVQITNQRFSVGREMFALAWSATTTKARCSGSKYFLATWSTSSFVTPRISSGYRST